MLEALSFVGAIALFRGVFTHRGRQDRLAGERRDHLAGAAATKLVATAGAGGIALTVWALRGYGLSGAEVATGMVCYEILTYGVYMAAMAICGFGLWLGVFSGPAPVGLTLIPAVFATVVIVIVLSMLFVDEPVERFLRRRARAPADGRCAVAHAPPRCRAPSTPGCGRRSPWSSVGIRASRRARRLGLRHRRAVGVVSRLRPLAARRRARDGLLRRHARQRAAAARAGSAASRAA